jgi:hypothetical protein
LPDDEVEAGAQRTKTPTTFFVTAARHAVKACRAATPCHTLRFSHYCAMAMPLTLLPLRAAAATPYAGADSTYYASADAPLRHAPYAITLLIIYAIMLLAILLAFAAIHITPRCRHYCRQRCR